MAFPLLSSKGNCIRLVHLNWCMCLWLSVCTYTCVFVCIYVCMYGWMSAWMDDACIRVCACMCLYIRNSINRYQAYVLARPWGRFLIKFKLFLIGRRFRKTKCFHPPWNPYHDPSKPIAEWWHVTSDLYIRDTCQRIPTCGLAQTDFVTSAQTSKKQIPTYLSLPTHWWVDTIANGWHA